MDLLVQLVRGRLEITSTSKSLVDHPSRVGELERRHRGRHGEKGEGGGKGRDGGLKLSSRSWRGKEMGLEI